MAKRRTVNVVNPWGIDIEQDHGRFVLIFESTEYKIKIHLDRSWVSHIASKLWSFLRNEQAAVERQIESLRGE